MAILLTIIIGRYYFSIQRIELSDLILIEITGITVMSCFMGGMILLDSFSVWISAKLRQNEHSIAHMYCMRTLVILAICVLLQFVPTSWNELGVVSSVLLIIGILISIFLTFYHQKLHEIFSGSLPFYNLKSYEAKEKSSESNLNLSNHLWNSFTPYKSHLIWCAVLIILGWIVLIALSLIYENSFENDYPMVSIAMHILLADANISYFEKDYAMVLSVVILIIYPMSINMGSVFEFHFMRAFRTLPISSFQITLRLLSYSLISHIAIIIGLLPLMYTIHVEHSYLFIGLVWGISLGFDFIASSLRILSYLRGAFIGTFIWYFGTAGSIILFAKIGDDYIGVMTGYTLIILFIGVGIIHRISTHSSKIYRSLNVMIST